MDCLRILLAVMQGVLAPIGGKRLVAFIDDFNMPQKTEFGFIPALELLKHWVHYGFWYAHDCNAIILSSCEIDKLCRALSGQLKASIACFWICNQAMTIGGLSMCRRTVPGKHLLHRSASSSCLIFKLYLVYVWK